MKLVAIAVAAALATSPAFALPWETFNDGGGFVGAFQDDTSNQFQLEINCDEFFGETEVLIRSRNEDPLAPAGAEVGTVYFSVDGQSLSTESFAFRQDSLNWIGSYGLDDESFYNALRAAMSTDGDVTVDFLGYRARFSGENASNALTYVDENC